MTPKFRRHAAAAALFAALLGALVPGFSRLLVAATGFDPAFYAICSAGGNAPADPHRPLAHLDACPYCASHGTTPAPPPRASAWLPAPGAGFALSTPIDIRVPDARPLRAAQPRAPPLVS
ncbi:MAG: DUF2946 family protein [Burkholderiales bacterium]|nr:DUF2946 family protein [Burkholderiales bacterium]